MQATMNKIDLMHATFGVDMKCRRCKDCICLVRVTESRRRYYKCTVYGFSNAESSDWTAKWTACGRFDKPLEPGEYSVLHQRKRGPRPKVVEVVPGQMEMEL